MEDQSSDTGMEPHQIQNIYQEDDVPFNDISGPTVRKLIYIGGFLFLVALAAAFIFRIPRELHLDLTLKGGLEEQVFQYPEKVYIQRTFVRTGEKVAKGDPLAVITSPAIVSLIGEIITWESRLAFYKNHKIMAREQELLLLQSKARGLEKEISLIQEEFTITDKTQRNEILQLQQQLKTQQKQHARNQKLFKEGVISELELERSFQALQQAEQKLLLGKSQNERSMAQLKTRLQEVSNRHGLSKKEAESYSSFSRLEENEITQNLHLARRKLELHYGSSVIENNSIVLKSPSNGHVTLISENESEVLPEQILLRLQRDSSRIVGYAEAGPEDIGQLKKGKKVVLKLKTFPHYYYGTLKAEISSLTPSPAANGNYPVTFHIREGSSLFPQLTKGMTGTASVIIEEKTLMGYLFKDLSKKTSEILDK